MQETRKGHVHMIKVHYCIYTMAQVVEDKKRQNIIVLNKR